MMTPETSKSKYFNKTTLYFKFTQGSEVEEQNIYQHLAWKRIYWAPVRHCVAQTFSSSVFLFSGRSSELQCKAHSCLFRECNVFFLHSVSIFTAPFGSTDITQTRLYPFSDTHLTTWMKIINNLILSFTRVLHHLVRTSIQGLPSALWYVEELQPLNWYGPDHGSPRRPRTDKI